MQEGQERLSWWERRRGGVCDGRCGKTWSVPDYAQSFAWTAAIQPDGSLLFDPADGIKLPADAGADVIYAGAGMDHVWGGAGDDVIYGEDGNDVLNGNGGSDMIFGGAGDDQIHGDGAVIVGGTVVEGNDYLDGGDGNDILLGGSVDDRMHGAAQNPKSNNALTKYLLGGAI